MRVALIAETFLPSVNGVTNTICRVLDHLAAHGHEALLFAPHDAPTSYAGAEIVSLGSMPLPFYPEVKLTPPQIGMTAHLRRFRPDVVHVVGPMMLGVSAATIVPSLGLPLISSYHTNFGTYTAHYGLGVFRKTVDAYLRWVHNHTLLTLCPSFATLRELRAIGFRRLRVWGRGVDTARFRPDHRSEAWRAAVGCATGETLLLYVGRLANEKRLHVLADAMRSVAGVRLVLVGDGPARGELQRRMAGLPVHWTGYLQGHDLAVAYASADAFVFPSDTETFGQVVQEAMASGLPVIGARSGGTLDLVRDGVHGVLFTPGSAASLADQIRRLLSAPHTRQAMGAASRAVVERRSWPAVMNELMQYYGRAVRRTHRAKAPLLVAAR